jgi:acetamidase/formamidase
MGRHHVVESTPETVHWGVFDAALAPVLTVRSGDTVTFHCVSGGRDVMPPAGSRLKVPPDLAAIHARCSPRLPGHILTGPVAVEGAEPGDTLEIRVREATPRCDWGWNVMRPLKGALPDDFRRRRVLHIDVDRARGVARCPWDMEIPLAPFFGVMGVAPPPEWGALSTIEPRAFGGNLDLKELTAGATLYLPVFAPGALFSVGDGHGVQGDGEVDVSALEIALTGTFELVLRKDLSLKSPRAETPTHWIAIGLDEDLDDAARMAVREMIRLLGELRNMHPEDAYALCSLAVDLRVTQVVDGVKGVHAMLRKSLLR